MDELIGVHFSRQSQLSDPKASGIRCTPIVHFATATVDWLCETDCTAWLLANERIPFRWVTDEDLNTAGLAGIRLLYMTAPDYKTFVAPIDMTISFPPGTGNRARDRYPISSDGDLTDAHFQPPSLLEGFHAIQAFNMISRVSTELGSIAGALKDPRVTKLIDVVLAPARAVIAASVPPPVPVPARTAPPGMTEMLKARDYIDQAIMIIGKEEKIELFGN